MVVTPLPENLDLQLVVVVMGGGDLEAQVGECWVRVRVGGGVGGGGELVGELSLQAFLGRWTWGEEGGC